MMAPRLKRYTTGSAAVRALHLSCPSDPVAQELVGFFALAAVDGVSGPGGLPYSVKAASDAAASAAFLPALAVR